MRPIACELVSSWQREKEPFLATRHPDFVRRRQASRRIIK